VLEARGQVDPRPMLFAGDRILDRLGLRFGDLADAQRACSPLAVAGELDRRRDRLESVRADGGEDLEIRPSFLAAIECIERLPLLLVSFLVDDQLPRTVALVDGTRPRVDPREAHALEPGRAEVALSNLPDPDCLASPRRGQRVELARTSPVA